MPTNFNQFNSDIMSKPAGDAHSRGARKLLRHEWQPNSATAQNIEAAVSGTTG